MRKIADGLLGIAFLAAIIMTGCSRNEQKTGKFSTASALKPAAAHGTSPASGAGSDAGLKFTPPEGWAVEQPASSMRKAQYRLPHVEGDPEDAELAVFFFGGGGGGVQANIDRWIGQFSKADGSPVGDAAKVTKRQANGIPLTIVEVTGTYNSAMGPMLSETKAKPNSRMLAAVAEAGSGPWFFKLTGPVKTVDKWEKSFYSFLDTLKQ